MTGGDQPNSRTSAINANSARKKLGTACPPMANSRTRKSVHRPCLTAPVIPTGIATIAANTIVYTASCNVTGNCRATSDDIGSRLTNERPPKSPVAMLHSHDPYCATTGSSSPNSCRTR